LGSFRAVKIVYRSRFIGLVTDLGSSHSFVGTEGFIPPEGPGTPQADLYALGKLLYELAAGLDRIEFPHLPADITRQADGEALLELNEVMIRGCAPDLQQRYSTAIEFQVELNLFLAGRSLRRARTIERGLARLRKFALPPACCWS
jgi:serine/threonine protein kinase